MTRRSWRRRDPAIEDLNARAGGDPGPKFFLFHRDRQWNEREQVWMGWERKRGKLEEFNRLVRGATDTSFTTQVGPLDALAGTRYCITLDSDTQLPRDAARELIGIISHPLNRPVIDPKLRRVTDGYGILQPRVSVTMASAAGSLFARTYAGHTGVDPYTTAVSDVYQDLFGEGIFTGKGLYDIDAFMTALEDRVPENALLSHDLFEGIHARAALVTDVEVVDDYPSNVLTHARRQHRWVRGDWQILWWLFPWVPTRAGLERNRLPLDLALEDPRQPAPQPRGAVARRVVHRRMVAAAGTADRVDAGRARDDVVPGHRARARRSLAGPRKGLGLRVFLRAWAEDLGTDLARVAIHLTFLAHQAWDMLDAVGVTLARLITRQGPLPAVGDRGGRRGPRAGGLASAASTTRCARARSSRASRCVAIAIAAAAGTAGGAADHRALGDRAADRAISSASPRRRRGPRSPHDDREYLKTVARATWKYFETLRRPRRSLAAARQRAVRSRAAHRASHLADQHRDEPAGVAVGARPRLHRRRRARRRGSKRR